MWKFNKNNLFLFTICLIGIFLQNKENNTKYCEDDDVTNTSFDDKPIVLLTNKTIEVEYCKTRPTPPFYRPSLVLLVSIASILIILIIVVIFIWEIRQGIIILEITSYPNSSSSGLGGIGDDDDLTTIVGNDGIITSKIYIDTERGHLKNINPFVFEYMETGDDKKSMIGISTVFIALPGKRLTFGSTITEMTME